MARKRGLKTVRSAGICTDSFDAEADNRSPIGEPLSQLDGDSGRMRSGFVGIQKDGLVVRSRVPAASEE